MTIFRNKKNEKTKLAESEDGNVVGYCPCCADKHINNPVNWQGINESKVTHVKVGLSTLDDDNDRKEWVWIKVENIKTDTVTGWLANIPVDNVGYEFEDYITVSKRDVVDVLTDG